MNTQMYKRANVQSRKHAFMQTRIYTNRDTHELKQN